MESGAPALGAQNLSHWTTREVPRHLKLMISVSFYAWEDASLGSLKLFLSYAETMCQALLPTLRYVVLFPPFYLLNVNESPFSLNWSPPEGLLTYRRLGPTPRMISKCLGLG